MSEYKLIYFEDCPNHLPAVELLRKLGIQFDEVCQDRLDDKNPLNGYSSPTLLKGDKIVFGSKAAGGGCSVSLPTLDELRELL